MKKLNIKFLGTGSAFVLPENNYQSNILIGRGDDNYMLFDCGSTCSADMDKYNISYNQIKKIFVSHLHADHIGGLEEVAFSSFFGPNPRVTLVLKKELKDELWEALRPGLNTIDQPTTLETYFDVQLIDDDFKIDNDLYIPFRTDHANMDSFGLSIKTFGSKIMITGDTRFDPNLMLAYETHDIIFQDCDFNKYPGGVHAQFHELCTLPAEIKSKMYLYHYDIKGLGMTFLDANKMVKEHGFNCLVKRGQELTID